MYIACSKADTKSCRLNLLRVAKNWTNYEKTLPKQNMEVHDVSPIS